MRRITAISLILVQLYMMGGYRLLFDSLQRRADNRLSHRLDERRYRDEDLLEIRVPVNLPYHSNWTEFEPYDGEVDFEGIRYRYVKRKLHNDTLILLAIPHADKMQLLNARDAFFALVNDMRQEEGDDRTTPPVKPVNKPFSFECTALSEQDPIAGSSQGIPCYCGFIEHGPRAPFEASDPKPPEAVC